MHKDIEIELNDILKGLSSEIASLHVELATQKAYVIALEKEIKNANDTK